VNNLKFGVLACALLGLIGCFLPFVKFGNESITFWKMHSIPGQGGQIYITMFGYLLALVAGVLAVAKAPMQRWQGILAAVGFAFVIFKMRDGFMKLITDGAIGAKMMAIMALVGLVIAVLCAAKPESAK
jgi:hypothetical protein